MSLSRKLYRLLSSGITKLMARHNCKIVVHLHLQFCADSFTITCICFVPGLNISMWLEIIHSLFSVLFILHSRKSFSGVITIQVHREWITWVRNSSYNVISIDLIVIVGCPSSIVRRASSVVKNCFKGNLLLNC